MLDSLNERARTLYQKNHRWIPIVAFVGGFLFDMTFLHRIDEPKVMIQQAAYLLVSLGLITSDLLGQTKFGKYREFFLHFFLGTLLNSYTIFYFKSASSITSFVFIFLLVLILIVSEFKRFGESQQKVHMALWSLCLVSYAQSFAPIMFGFMGIMPFLASGFGAILIFAVYFRFLQTRFKEDPEFLKSRVLYPYLIVQGVFTALYFLHAIPPVPLSISYIGIYHEVKKENGDYKLSFNRESILFWEHGDQNFEARPGDTVYAFVEIYSPSGFKDQLKVRWLYNDDTHGWQAQDAIPLTVTGGRENGYRAITQKSNYQSGRWRVQVETKDAHEVGRLDFTISDDTETTPRVYQIDTR